VLNRVKLWCSGKLIFFSEMKDPSNIRFEGLVFGEFLFIKHFPVFVGCVGHVRHVAEWSETPDF